MKLYKKGEPGSARPLVWTLIVTVAAVFVAVLGNIWYTNHIDRNAQERTRLATEQAIQKSNQQWCNIVLLFDNTYRQNPPTTPTGKQIAEYFAVLRKNFSC